MLSQVVDELFSYWTLEDSEDTLEQLEELLIVRLRTLINPTACALALIALCLGQHLCCLGIASGSGGLLSLMLELRTKHGCAEETLPCAADSRFRT